jgi:hypothetical protein
VIILPPRFFLTLTSFIAASVLIVGAMERLPL